MITLVGIEGAEGDARAPNSAYAGSFIHELVTGWSGTAAYVPGPSSDPKGVMPTAVTAMQHAAVMRSSN